MPTRNVYIRDAELDKWVAKKVEGGRYRSYSHAVEVALKQLKAREEINPPRPF
jgi:Arc/MetJ-type ribon-helix-helix transcriptional regulator